MFVWAMESPGIETLHFLETYLSRGKSGKTPGIQTADVSGISVFPDN